MNHVIRLRWLARYLIATIAVIAILLGISATVTQKAHAVSATDFNPGNIISDSQLYDGDAMSAEDIQSFLDARVPRCTIGDPGKPAGGMYHDPSGWSVKLATHCLKDGKYRTTAMLPNAYCASYPASVDETAAAIIAKIGRACGISQKALLVMLEKEQGLIQDNFPAQHQLDRAMGYACPDSGPNNSANCDTRYYGFFNQVYYAAWQLNLYKAFPASYSFKPFQMNTVKWAPNNNCGTSEIYIENWATAGLYNYTPYRPNQAALNAGWGVGDGCSSYGNRNFFLLYNTWFSNQKPFGDLNSATIVSPGQLLVRGWAIDPDTAAPITVHVNVGSQSFAFTANVTRADVGEVYRDFGAQHGFEAIIDVSALSGEQQVCLYGIDNAGGASSQIECQVVNVSLPAQGVRVGGADRYETAATISQHAYPGLVGGTVVLVTGENYPDSLSAAPLAAKLGAPVLLTNPSYLPSATRTEIQRLAPTNILIVGGIAAVSEAVEREVAEMLVGQVTVRRISGDDRYATSLAVLTDDAGWASSTEMFVATGESFADALSAGAAAGTIGAPVLLVRGTDNAAGNEQVQLLDGLGVTNLRVAGGPAAVSQAMVDSLAVGRAIQRYSGSDRYETSAQIGSEFNVPNGSVYLASGSNFADALSGAAVAGTLGAPLLLSETHCVPASIRILSTSIRPSTIIVLGGVNALSEEVRLHRSC